tara:strand:- start:229 stop:543 length:315 start_codon:yes stop_codon:yes gene_type:complete
MSRYDNIEDLPTDEKSPDVNELYLVNTLFTNNNDSAQLFNGLQDTVLSGFLFLLLTMPFINNLIKNVFKFTKNSFVLFILLKSFIFMILYFIIVNFALIKKTVN